MIQHIRDTLVDWNKSTSERHKLQHAYVALSVALLLVAGLIGLLDNELGKRIASLAVVALAVFVVNAVVWSLLESSVFSRLRKKR
jgi:NADH:ubiquinone oxidoreductase subunit 6 (subunit J)